VGGSMTLQETIRLLDAPYCVHLTEPEHVRLWLDVGSHQKPEYLLVSRGLHKATIVEVRPVLSDLEITAALEVLG
jgi:hypothetical protein